MNIELCEFSIIILNWNLASYTKKCIDSIIKYTHNINYEIILVDNGSTEKESLDLFSAYKNVPNIRIVRNKENLRVAAGNNSGFKIAKGKYFLMLNNDTEIKEEDWYVNTIRLFQSDWKLGIIGTAGGYHDKNLNHVASFLATKKEIQVVEYVEGWCMWTRKQIYQKIGGLDERYYLFCEDSDYCFSAKKLGYKVVIIPHNIIHYGGKTHKKKPEILVYSQESSKKLKEKWNSSPDTSPPKNILCIRYEARGDVFLCLPAVRTLRKEYPNHFIHFLTLPDCKEVLVREWKNIDKIWTRSEKTIQQLSKIHFDLVINFQDHQKYGQDLKRLFYKQYRGNNNPLMQNTEKSQRLRWREGKKYVKIFGEIAEIKVENKLEYPLIEKDYNILDKYKLQEKKYICINLESCWESRHFGREWIEEFLLLCRGKEIVVVLLGTDTGLKKLPNCTNLIRKTTIAEAKVVIENSALFLTIDSLLLHIAQSITNSSPIFCMFTATPSNYVLTNSKKITVFTPGCCCSPCFTGYCKNTKKKICTQELSPTIILEKIEEKITVQPHIEITTNPKKVAFFGAFSTLENIFSVPKKLDYNYGDHLILQQEKKDIIEKNTTVRVLTMENVRENLVKYVPDVLIIGGGGLLHPAMQASGWSFPLSTKEIDQLVKKGTKIIILAIGKNMDKEAWSYICWQNMAHLLKKASLISGRDRNTVNFLYQHNPNKEVMLCPDPVLFTFMGLENQNRGKYELNIPWTPILEPTDIWEIVGRTKLNPCILLQGSFWQDTPENDSICLQFPTLGLKSPDDYLAALKGGSITLSATLHGCILSLSLGIPAILGSKNVERIRGFKNLFLENLNSFPCILEKNESNLIQNLLEQDFSKTIENRKQFLYNIYKCCINKVKEIIYGKK